MIADGNKADELSMFCEKVNGSPPGSVFVIPTDTVYCVVCKARNQDEAKKFTPNNEGIQTLYKVKSRPSDKPVSLWFADFSFLDEADFDPVLWRFMKAVWPGPVALVLNKGPWLDKVLPGWSESKCGTTGNG